jgi:DNA-binding response OmpR family regulator
MIVIVSNSPTERRALAALCESRGWDSVECDTVRAAKRSFRSVRPRVLLTRHRLPDGYSDDLMADLHSKRLAPAVRVIVLLGSGTTSAQTARQIALGVDSVHRDPIRAEVLAAFVEKYLKSEPTHSAAAAAKIGRPFPLAGAMVHPLDRQLRSSRRVARLTPREVQLAEMLYESRGEVVTYAALYSEIMGSRFRGETSNMRVLLGLLGASFRSLGINLRNTVEVIAKTGYRYTQPRTRRSPRTADDARIRVS